MFFDIKCICVIILFRICILLCLEGGGIFIYFYKLYFVKKKGGWVGVLDNY